MKNVIIVLIILFLVGCSTTYISKTEVRPDGTKIKHIAYHKNRFAEKSFDNLSANVSDIKVSAKNYTSILNEKAIAESGNSVGQVVEGAVEGAVKGAKSF